MYFCKLGDLGTGLTNQIFSLITAIITARRMGHRLVIVDRFLNDFSKLSYTPVSSILDMVAINTLLLAEYGMMIVDREELVTFSSAIYGITGQTVDLTERLHQSAGGLLLPKETVLNSLGGDPAPGCVKQLRVTYTVYGQRVEEIYNELLEQDLSLDFDRVKYIYSFAMPNVHDLTMFDNILTSITYHKDLVAEADSLFQSGTKNVIHLRLEWDGIAHWSKMNQMTEDSFHTALVQRYTSIIEQEFAKSEEILILSSSLANPVIDFLNANGYNYRSPTKFYQEREKNAIIDLLVASRCNGLFIGNFNLANFNGSTFSYYAMKLCRPVKAIMIDLDRIADVESTYYKRRTLVLFVFHEMNRRVASFFRFAIFKDPGVDFILIANGKRLEFEVPPYVRVLRRDNLGYDFGGWSDGLLTDDLYKEYSSFIFVNSSVIGPFMRPGDGRRWTDIYLGGLVGDVKLFGSTINTCMRPMTNSHVQSYIFALDRSTLDYLIECGIFSMRDYVKTLDAAVHSREIAMSRRVIERGWNIGSLLTYYKGVDFTFSDRQPEAYGLVFMDDMVRTSCYNLLWNEYDLVFVKGNRGFAVDGVSPPLSPVITFDAITKACKSQLSFG
uniref:Uncharacterized protein n=1 Tax=viral metagenome TaxID=1070528 RepID=A0A6C0DR71_9ZZZZ